MKARRSAIFVGAGIVWAASVIVCGRVAVSCAAIDPGVAVAVLLAGIYAPSFAACWRAEAGFLAGCLTWGAGSAYFAAGLLGDSQVETVALLAAVYWAYIPVLGVSAYLRQEAAH